MGRRPTIFLGTPTTAVKFCPERGGSVVCPVGRGRLAELADRSRFVDVPLDGCPGGSPEGTNTSVCSRFEGDPEVWVTEKPGDEAEEVGNGPCFGVEEA